MSYILDALRKSDQQRQRGATPTLLTAPVAAAEPRPSEHWIYALIAAVLVGAGIVIGWLQPWQSEPADQAPVARDALAAKPPEAGQRQSESRPPYQVQSAAPLAAAPSPAAPVAASPQAPPKPARERDVGESKAARAVSQGAAEVTRQGASTPARATPEQAAAAPAPVAQQVMTVAELPASVRDGLPEMQVSLHLYSTRPENSFVNINNKMLQEGAVVAPGLKLENITPEGMVFSYQGYRFRRGVQ